MSDIIAIVVNILGGLFFGFFCAEGVDMVRLIHSCKKKGYYETGKWRYTRVRKDV
jgi:hypothetical protein